MKKTLLLIFYVMLSVICFSQKKTTTRPNYIKPFLCNTFVYNLSLDEMKMKDICFEVIKGEYINMNEYSQTKKKENELWKFKISIIDNKTLSSNSYEGTFYIYENYSQDIIQYHSFVDNDQFKAIIYDKNRNSWQVLLLQNDEYKILSTYSGYSYTNAFGITSRKKSNISY